jgi:lactoylglutathione lyase
MNSKQLMEIKTTGCIIYAIKYQDCIRLYRDVLNLEVMYEKESLTCFQFGQSYLMVEIADDEDEIFDNISVRDRTCLRINAENVMGWCELLDSNDIPYELNQYDWGTIAKFRDPDGNLIGIRSAREHEIDKIKGLEGSE